MTITRDLPESRIIRPNEHKIYHADGSAAPDRIKRESSVATALCGPAGAINYWTGAWYPLVWVSPDRRQLGETGQNTTSQLTCRHNGIYRVQYRGEAVISTTPRTIMLQVFVDGVAAPGAFSVFAAVPRQVWGTGHLSLVVGQAVQLRYYAIWAGGGGGSHLTGDNFVINLHFHLELIG